MPEIPISSKPHQQDSKHVHLAREEQSAAISFEEAQVLSSLHSLKDENRHTLMVAGQLL